jgi:hypothetical protein
MNDFNDVKDILPPFGKIVELQGIEGRPYKASLYDFIRSEGSEGYVRWLCRGEEIEGIQFSTATKWRFINEQTSSINSSI